ncbi:MAG: excinuclease ABC subunit UvrA, partial [Lachnospiraceae bacterium]|nr:excinuclease ABC subunit UvrA [Lachnospiraceae bacterium]
MSERKYIKIRGAKEHNLKGVNIDIPRNEFVVLTGLSGSGKSSLAFDTIYAEGQRRYMESLSSYARQFLGQMEKPDVEKIEGLPPAISIDQKSTNRNPRSTVGTVTEIYDYFRLLYARIGIPHCPKCGREIKKQTVDQMVDQIMSLPERTRIQLLAPVVRGRKGEHQKLFEKAKKSGYVRVQVDGSVYELTEEIKLDKNKKHNIEIVVDRLVVKEGMEKRLTDSIENVLDLAEGLLMVEVVEGETLNFSQSFSCPDCGISVDEIEPRSFSFNNPFGACPVCFGLGYKMEFDEDLMIPDKSLSIAEGAIQVMGWQSCTDPGSYTYAILQALSKEFDFDLAAPYQDLSEEVRQMLIHGTERSVKVYYKGQRGEGVYDVVFEGLISNAQRRYRETGSDVMKQEYEQFMRITPCQECKGQRLKKTSLAVTVSGKNIFEITNMSVKNLQQYLLDMELSSQQKLIGNQILKEIRSRVGFLVDVGLEYLSLSRATGTLSGGEAQRIRLATQVGSGLVGVAYILDEPSIGLHQRDNDKLLATLKGLRDLGNTLVVVEHDEDTMLAADYIVD